MKVPSSIFRQYDIRGVVGEQLDAQVAHAIGRAVATEARKRIGKAARLAVGRDNRPSGDLLAHAVRDGMAAAGATAVDVGMVPTPALYLALHELEVDGGVQVTGSHNPPEFNGFKMVVADATLYGEDIQGLRRLIEDDATDDGAGRLEVETTMLERYGAAILERNGTDERFEQGRVSAGGESGGKRPRQGERGRGPHGPSTEAGSRVPGAGSGAASSTLCAWPLFIRGKSRMS